MVVQSPVETPVGAMPAHEAASVASTPRRRRKDARPSELTAAALDLFVEKGFAATRLEEAGLLCKSEHRTDRRLIVLELTPSGQALMRRLGRIARDFQARLAQELGDDGPALERALSRLITAEPESPARN